jgi:hypothetical protein
MLSLASFFVKLETADAYSDPAAQETEYKPEKTFSIPKESQKFCTKMLEFHYRNERHISEY